MHRHDQGAHVAFAEILHFVDQQDHGDAAGLGGFADCGEQLREVSLQIAAIGGADFWIDIQRKFSVVELDFYAGHEALEHAQAVLHVAAECAEAVKVQQHTAELGDEEGGERLAFVRLDDAGPVSGIPRHVPQMIQQDRFADTAQADGDEAFRGTARFDPLERDLRLMQKLLTPDQFGW